MGAAEALRQDNFEELETERCDGEQYQRSSMQRDVIIDKLRHEGCRITRQRKIILDIILEEDCTCCKEIYFLAAREDPNIGIATIYRMINLLEKVGALKRKRAYHIYGTEDCGSCNVRFDDSSSICLEGDDLRKVIEKGMECCGYLEDRKISGVFVGDNN